MEEWTNQDQPTLLSNKTDKIFYSNLKTKVFAETFLYFNYKTEFSITLYFFHEIKICKNFYHEILISKKICILLKQKIWLASWKNFSKIENLDHFTKKLLYFLKKGILAHSTQKSKMFFFYIHVKRKFLKHLDTYLKQNLLKDLHTVASQRYQSVCICEAFSFFQTLQYFFLYPTSLCFSSSEKFFLKGFL